MDNDTLAALIIGGFALIGLGFWAGSEYEWAQPYNQEPVTGPDSAGDVDAIARAVGVLEDRRTAENDEAFADAVEQALREQTGGAR